MQSAGAGPTAAILAVDRNRVKCVASYRALPQTQTESNRQENLGSPRYCKSAKPLMRWTRG